MSGSWFFLNQIRGLIHVGGNTGQERDLYHSHDLDVIWLEPIPEIYLSLTKNIAVFPKQKAFQYLVTDIDHREYQFNISNNEGASSSIFKLNLHQQIWPNIYYEDSIQLRSMRLDSIIKKESICIQDYQALVLDTQGSELLVLRGADTILNHFRFIKTEAADFESYDGCCQMKDLECYLQGFGFREVLREPFMIDDNIGTYYDVVYQQD